MAPTQPQLDFVLISISVVFTGMNAVLFFFCVYALWGQKSKSSKLLLFSSTIQFGLSLAQTILLVVHISVLFTFYLNEFRQHLFQLNLPIYIIFLLNTVIEGSLLIWRIYILYNSNIMICIPTIILLLLEIAFAGATAKGVVTLLRVNLEHIHIFYLTTWSLIAAVDVSATTLICLRLWVAHQNAKTILSVSKYKSTIIIVVECGVLVTICSLATLILHLATWPTLIGSPGQGVATQAATMAPLLIIARYGILSRREDRRMDMLQEPLRINVIRTEDTRVDTPVEFTGKNRSMVSDPLPVLSGADHVKPFCDA